MVHLLPLTNTITTKLKSGDKLLMMKKVVKAVIASAVLAAAALAHGGAEHVMGVAKAVSADSITVETAKKESITILVTAKTEVKKSAVAAKITDLKVGERVAVHAEKNKAGKLEAEEVEFGPSPAKK